MLRQASMLEVAKYLLKLWTLQDSTKEWRRTLDSLNFAKCFQDSSSGCCCLFVFSFLFSAVILLAFDGGVSATLCIGNKNKIKTWPSHSTVLKILDNLNLKSHFLRTLLSLHLKMNHLELDFFFLSWLWILCSLSFEVTEVTQSFENLD